jgi:hypothetical protein
VKRKGAKIQILTLIILLMHLWPSDRLQQFSSSASAKSWYAHTREKTSVLQKRSCSSKVVHPFVHLVAVVGSRGQPEKTSGATGKRGGGGDLSTEPQMLVAATGKKGR